MLSARLGSVSQEPPNHIKDAVFTSTSDSWERVCPQVIAGVCRGSGRVHSLYRQSCTSIDEQEA
jgi:hypothetical protein